MLVHVKVCTGPRRCRGVAWGRPCPGAALWLGLGCVLRPCEPNAKKLQSTRLSGMCWGRLCTLLCPRVGAARRQGCSTSRTLAVVNAITIQQYSFRRPFKNTRLCCSGWLRCLLATGTSKGVRLWLAAPGTRPSSADAALRCSARLLGSGAKALSEGLSSTTVIRLQYLSVAHKSDRVDLQLADL